MDYYKVLEVGEDATADEIKKSYRVLARKYHPDVSKDADAEEKFKQLSEAYRVLKDKQKRADYDELRKYGGGSGGDFQAPPGWQQQTAGKNRNWQYTADSGGQSSDFFSEIFGNQSRGSGGRDFSMHGEDVHYTLQVSLEEAFNGAQREISFQSQDVDRQGRPSAKTNNLNVTIPKGVVSGQQLRLRSKGNPGFGTGQPGDLYLEIEVKPHPHFAIEGRDLTLVLPVTPWEVALGEAVEVPTFTGKIKVTIPDNAKAGQKIRLKGKGLPGKPPGNLFVVLQIVLPEKLSEEQKALFAEMKNKFAFNPREGIKV